MYVQLVKKKKKPLLQEKATVIHAWPKKPKILAMFSLALVFWMGTNVELRKKVGIDGNAYKDMKNNHVSRRFQTPHGTDTTTTSLENHSHKLS